MIATGIIFFLMIFCAFPICCYNKEKELTEQDQENYKETELKSNSRSAAYIESGNTNMGPNRMN